jgi:hypothetical protein
MPYLESYIYEAPGFSPSPDAAPLSATPSYPVTLIISTIITSGIMYPTDVTTIPRSKKKKRKSTTSKIPLQGGEFQVSTETNERNSLPEWFRLFLSSRPINHSVGDHEHPTLPGEKLPFLQPSPYTELYTESTLYTVSQPIDLATLTTFNGDSAQGFIFLRLLIALLCVFCLLSLFCLIQIILYVSRYRLKCFKFVWRKTHSSSYDTSMVHDMDIENGHSCEVEMEDFNLSSENDVASLLPANSRDCSDRMNVNRSKVKGNKGIKEDVYGSEVSLASSEKN